MFYTGVGIEFIRSIILCKYEAGRFLIHVYTVCSNTLNGQCRLTEIFKKKKRPLKDVIIIPHTHRTHLCQTI